jgi:protease I
MKNRINLLTTVILGLVVIFTACSGETASKDYDDKKADKVKVAVLLGEGFHDGEAYMPIGYLYNLGARITVIGIESGTVKAYNSDFTINIQKSVTEVSVDDFDALILPGGQAPDVIRHNEDVVAFAKAFYESGKVVAAICHGPQILITAGVLDGVKATSFPAIQEEMEDAGVIWDDVPLVIDANLITSRVPRDLSQFCEAIAKAIFEKK